MLTENSTTKRLPGETREDAKRRAQRAAQAQFDENRRASREVARGLHSKLLFWSVCSHKPCQRAHACRGDVDACGRRCFPYVPEDVKAALQGFLQAMHGGATHAEALRAGEAAAERCREIDRQIAEREREMALPAPAQDREETPGEAGPPPPRRLRAPHGPRVRGL